MPHADAPRPPGDAPRRNRALVGREHLRVADAGEVLVRGDDRRDGHRTGPRTPADLVDADHRLDARFPHLAFEPQGRKRPALHGLTVAADRRNLPEQPALATRDTDAYAWR